MDVMSLVYRLKGLAKPASGGVEKLLRLSKRGDGMTSS